MGSCIELSGGGCCFASIPPVGEVAGAAACCYRGLSIGSSFTGSGVEAYASIDRLGCLQGELGLHGISSCVGYRDSVLSGTYIFYCFSAEIRVVPRKCVRGFPTVDIYYKGCIVAVGTVERTQRFEASL